MTEWQWDALGDAVFDHDLVTAAPLLALYRAEHPESAPESLPLPCPCPQPVYLMEV